MQREEIVQMARLAEQTERFDDAFEIIKGLLTLNVDPHVSELNLLKRAANGAIGPRMNSWKIICSIEQNPDNPSYLDKIKEYQDKIEGELFELCQEIVRLLENNVETNTTLSQTAQASYLALQGKYGRYLVEISSEPDKQTFSDQALTAYLKAYEIAQKEFQTIEPGRLELARDLSLFYYQIVKSPEQAISIARDAFSLAKRDIERSHPGDLKESVLIMEVLRNNLFEWTNQTMEQE